MKQSSEARFRNLKHASRLWVVSSWIAPNQCCPLTIELRHAGRDDRRHHAYRRAPSGPETKISAFERLRCSWILNPTPLVPRSNPRTWPTRTKHCEKSAAPPRKTSRVITRGTRRMMCVSFTNVSIHLQKLRRKFLSRLHASIQPGHQLYSIRRSSSLVFEQGHRH